MISGDTVSDSDQQGTVSDSEADIGDLEVRNRADLGRYELLQDGVVVGHADYSLRDDEITIPHVETERSLRKRGLGSKLMEGVIADVVDRQLTVVPVCPFAADYLHDHPDLAYLIKR